MARKTLLTTGFISIILFITGGAAAACPCAVPPPVCKAYSESAAVFVGRVTGSTDKQLEFTRPDGTKEYGTAKRFEFAVEEAFLGIIGSTAFVHGNGLQEGARYLVYADVDNNKELWTGFCGRRTALLSEAGEDLKFLRELPDKEPGLTIFGRVINGPQYTAAENSPKLKGMSSISITIKDDDGNAFRLMTDAEGRYKLGGLKPGKYEITAGLPNSYAQEDSTQVAEINDRNCACQEFYAVADGRVSGKLTDNEGNPLKEVEVLLVSLDAEKSADEEEPAGFAYTDKAGAYDFRQVSPGRYLIGINIRSSPDENFPFPAVYYPGTIDRNDATIIEIGLGEKLKDRDFKTTKRLAGYTVEGIVLWPDGTPAAGATVQLVDTGLKDVVAASIVTDETGHFSLTGFENINYRLTAELYLASNEPDKAEAEQIVEESSETESSLEDSSIETDVSEEDSSEQAEPIDDRTSRAEFGDLKLTFNMGGLMLVLKRPPVESAKR